MHRGGEGKFPRPDRVFFIFLHVLLAIEKRKFSFSWLYCQVDETPSNSSAPGQEKSVLLLAATQLKWTFLLISCQPRFSFFFAFFHFFSPSREQNFHVWKLHEKHEFEISKLHYNYKRAAGREKSAKLTATHISPGESFFVLFSLLDKTYFVNI